MLARIISAFLLIASFLVALPTMSGETKGKLSSAQKLLQIRRGKKLYEANECAACHIAQGKGASGGVALDEVDKSRTRAFVLSHLADPEEHVAKYAAQYGFQPNLMPHPNLADHEREAIAAYIMSLCYRPAEVTTPAAIQPLKIFKPRKKTVSKQTGSKTSTK